MWQKFIDEEQPDIFCLQETKAKPEQIELEMPGYEQFWYSAEKPGYCGVALFSKLKPLQVINGFPQTLSRNIKSAATPTAIPTKRAGY